MLHGGTRGNRNLVCVLCICWWEVRGPAHCSRGTFPRTELLSPRHPHTYGTATGYLRVCWKRQILGLHNGVSVIYRPRCLREPLVLIHSHPKPRVTQDALQIKYSWNSHLTFSLLRKILIFLKDLAEFCPWPLWIPPRMMILNVYEDDLCTSDDYQITYTALLERSEQAHKSPNWFRHILCCEKQRFVIKCSSGPRASLHPKLADGSQPRLSHVHREPQVRGSVARVKPAAAIHISNLFWTLIWKHHFLPENFHLESTYSLITFLE